MSSSLCTSCSGGVIHFVTVVVGGGGGELPMVAGSCSRAVDKRPGIPLAGQQSSADI